MPTSQKPRRKLSSLTRAKNSIRGSNNPTEALSHAIRTVPPFNQRGLLEWAESVSFGMRAPTRDAFPRIPRDISSISSEDKGNFIDLVNLVAARSIFYASKLQSFLQQKREFDVNLNRSNFEHCERTLYAIESDFGYSNWLVKLKIAILALKEGLEAQKKFSDTVINEYGRTPFSSLVRFTSQRNEDSTSAARFVARMRNILDKAQLQQSTRVYYNYHLIHEMPVEDEHRRWLLLHQLQISIIDAYEALIAISLEIAALELEDFPNDLLLVINALQVLNDPRTSKLRFLTGSADTTVLHTRNLDWDEALLRGNLSADKRLISADINDPRSVWIEALVRAARDDVPSRTETMRDNGVLDFLRMSAQVDSLEDAVNAITKRSLNLDPSATNLFAICLARDASSSDAPFSKARLCRAALASSYLDPWDLPFLPDGVKDAYFRALTERYGNVIVVRYMAWLANLENTPQSCEISPTMIALGKVVRANRTSDFHAMLRSIPELLTADSFKILANRWQCHAFLGVGDYRLAIRAIADRLVESPAYYSLLPIDRILFSNRWKDLKPYATEIGLPVLLDFVFRRTGRSEIGSFRRYAVEDFLESRSVNRPSELGISPAGIPKETLIYFLSEVCVPEVLDLVASFPTSRSVQEERRAVCALLVELAPESASKYRDEITKITAALTVDEGVRLVDQSRVFVDKDGILRWASSELQESFDRYRSMYEAHVGFDSQEFLLALRNFLENQRPIPEQFLSLPKGEADKLLIQLISDLRDNFLLSPSHGLDAFLSVRVRHGTLSGMLRGPLEQNHIINQRSSEGGRYQKDPFWLNALPEARGDDLDLIERAIMRFSEGYDQVIEELRERLQIKRKDRPNGLFEIPIKSLHVHWLREQINKDVSLEDFVTGCFELFWVSLDESLNAVQKYISFDFRGQVGALFEKLSADLVNATKGARYPKLNDAVNRARNEVQAVMDGIRSWFQGIPAAKRAYPVGQAIDVALEVVRITYRNFNPLIAQVIETEGQLMIDSVTAIGDVVFTALDNVHKHSGMENPRVTIEIRNRDENSISMIIESEVAPSVDKESGARRLAEISTKIKRGEFKTLAVSGEGGTGLMKLKNLVDPAGIRDEALQFGFTDNATFMVTAVIRTYGGT